VSPPSNGGDQGGRSFEPRVYSGDGSQILPRLTSFDHAGGRSLTLREVLQLLKLVEKAVYTNDQNPQRPASMGWRMAALSNRHARLGLGEIRAADCLMTDETSE
jgi:hypothetical protein